MDKDYCELTIMKIQRITITLTIFIFGFCTNSFAKESLIESYLRKSGVVIIGDTGFDLESTALVKNIIEEYVSTKGCINIGLDITSDQQETVDKALKGEQKFNKLKLNPYVDKKSYIDLLLGIRKLIKEGKCLKVYAIDKPDSQPEERDAWMAKRVQKLVGIEPVLVLSGNLQTIKKITWLDEDNNTRFLAERVRRKEIKTSSIMQYWTKGECEERMISKIILSQGPRAEVYINDVLGSVGAKVSKRPSEVVDALIVWRCPRDRGAVVDNTASTDIEIPEEPVDITDTIKDTDLKLDDIKLSDLKNDIKKEKLKVGMSKDHVLLAKGLPTKAIKRIDLGDKVEQWIYECSDDWGFDYECVVVTFNGNKVAKILDIE